MSTLQGDKGSDTCLYYKVKKVRNEEARNEEGRGKKRILQGGKGGDTGLY